MDRNLPYLGLHRYRRLSLPRGLDSHLNHGRKPLLSNQLLLLDSRRKHRDMGRYHHYHPHPYLDIHLHRSRLNMYSSIVHHLDRGLRGLVLSRHRYQCLPDYHHNHRNLRRFYLDSSCQLGIHLEHPRLHHYRHRGPLFRLYSHLHHNRSWLLIPSHFHRIDIDHTHPRFHLGRHHSNRYH